MSRSVSSLLKSFLLGLSCCALATIVVQAQRPALPFLDEVPQLKAKILENADSHWAFQPIEKPSLPVVNQKSWVKNPIDLFVLQKLEKAGRPPAEPADSHVLLRRAHFDLLGFPPHAQTVLIALETYGMIVADNGIDWCISVTPDKRIKGLDTLTRVKGYDFEVIVPTGPREGTRARQGK
jgi:hypothetical protein